MPAIGRAFRERCPDVELLSQEMWNAEMFAALQAGTIDAAISLCPDSGAGIESEALRTEPVVAVLGGEAAAAREGVVLRSLARETFLLFPRELAPRLHDVLVGVCRDAGFDPKLRNESFHTA